MGLNIVLMSISLILYIFIYLLVLFLCFFYCFILCVILYGLCLESNEMTCPIHLVNIQKG